MVTATELKQHLGKYLAHVEGFNEVVITKNGTKVARLTPYITDFEQYLVVQERVRGYQYGGKKVSYEEFMEIFSKSDLRMELINGEIHIIASPSITHQEILGLLYLIFHEYFEDHECRVCFAPFDVHFYKKNVKDPDVCQPDLMVFCDLEGNVIEQDRYTGIPTLVLEILSDSTRNKDMIDKLNTYRLAGVQEYWIVDPKQRNIIIYSFDNLDIDSYRTYGKGQIAQSVAFQGLEAAVTEVFGD